MQDLICELRDRLKDAVAKKRRETTGILLSGGLDSSIVAALAPGMVGFNITMAPYGDDLRYAERLAQFLNIRLYHRIISIEEALSTIPEVIRILKTFDPAIPNDVTVYVGLKLAKEKGITTVMTGDGADELFGGYSFMWDLDNLNDYITRLSKRMGFSSNILGHELGIEVYQPFLDKEVINLALRIPANLKVNKENGKLYGKWILRKAFEDILPEEFIWQKKRALEYGSGTTRLRQIISSRISDKDFQVKQRSYPVNFMNKEHLFFFETYKEVVGEIPAPKEREISCSGCGAGIAKDSRHCRICGRIKDQNTKHRKNIKTKEQWVTV